MLQDVPRKIDLPARYGGEEFVVILEGADVAQAKMVAERIRTEIGKLVVETDKGPLSITESIGVSSFPDDGRECSTLFERADAALYHAKQTGRNRVITWAEAQAAKAKKARKLKRKLRRQASGYRLTGFGQNHPDRRPGSSERSWSEA